MRSSVLSKPILLTSIIFLCAAVLIAQLLNIHLRLGDTYRAQAERSYTAGVDDFDRGSIFFTEKSGTRISAATLERGFLLALNPMLLADPADAYGKIAGIVPLERASFMEKAAQKTDPYEELARRIGQESARKIAELKIPGIIVAPESWRRYPGGKTGAHLLGFVGYKGDTLSGRYGLEAYYEDVLARRGDTMYANFFAQAFSLSQSLLAANNEREGDIVTSIEPTVQASLEKAIVGVNKKWSSESSGGLIMDPKTGEIYALAAVPDFDPNAFGKEKDSGVFLNPLVESVFEMGSIIKPLTIAAGLDTGAVTSATTYNDRGSVTVDGITIRNFDGKGRGVVPLQGILDESLNTGAVYVMQRTGEDRFRTYLQSFALGEETGIDLPGEVPGNLGNLEEGRAVDYAAASFGQGIATTPVAMARALSALGNGGILPDPHLVRGIDFRFGFSSKTGENTGTRVLKSETAEEVTRLLVHVVDYALQNGAVKHPRYSIAAKTGTAQIARPGGKGYYDDRYLHTFFGYFPAYDPKFLVFLYTEYPKGVRYAAHTLSDPFRDLSRFLIHYYQIPPDR